MPQEEAIGIPDLLPLDGVRVVELADWRGEFLGRLLANLGADVIKVEPPGGAPSRSLGPFQNDTEDPERSIFWWHFNVGKRGLTLDISNDEGRALLDRLLGTADIFVETLGLNGLDRRRPRRLGRRPRALAWAHRHLDYRLRARRPLGLLRRRASSSRWR